jgi:hypothetical protein
MTHGRSIVEISGHIIDTLILPKILDLIVHLNNAKQNLAVIHTAPLVLRPIGIRNDLI